METQDVMAWIWVQNEQIIKAVYHKTKKTLIIYDEHDKILLKREGVQENHIKKIEIIFLSHGAQRMDSPKESFSAAD